MSSKQIRVEQNVYKELAKRKLYKRETFSDVIARLLWPERKK